MAVPVIGQSRLDLEVLAGEAEVVCFCAGEGDGFTPREIGGLPDGGLGRVGHSGGAAEVIGVDIGDCAGCAGDVGYCEWQIDGAIIIGGLPDIISCGGPCAGCSLGDDVAFEVIDISDIAHGAAYSCG